MSAFNKNGGLKRAIDCAKMKARNLSLRALERVSVASIRMPSVAEQDAMIAYLKTCEEADLIAKMRDKEWRYQANAVFMAWRLRNQLRTIRTRRGLTQGQLADKAGLHQSMIARLENIYCPVNVTVKTLLRIAHALDVAFICRFESWGSFINDVLGMNCDHYVESFNEQYGEIVTFIDGD
jgi:transcriptional regulator with XRE-family HTH domain